MRSEPRDGGYALVLVLAAILVLLLFVLALATALRDPTRALGETGRAKRELGTTLGRYFETMKIEWAQVLLRESSLQVEEVARRVGYEDAFYFSRVFRKGTGRSPRAWRARQKNDET